MAAVSRKWSLLFAISISLAFGGICLVTLTYFLHTPVIPCAETTAANLILSSTLVLVFQIFLSPKILPKRYKYFLASHVTLILFSLWLGLYPISPLGYSSGRIPNLRGFLVIRANRNSIIGNREIVSLQQGSAVGISPLLLPGDFKCDWMSTAGGELDDSSSCDTVYIPPNADFDVLRLRIRSTCGLPDSTGQLKVSILP